MARQSTLTSLKEISEINLTPLMDLTFILLIAFIITYPLIEQGIPIQLPTGEAEELDRSETRTITVSAEGELFLDDVPITDEVLAVEMQDLSAALPDVTVYIRADRRIAYGRVADILQILHAARITRTALVTQPES